MGNNFLGAKCLYPGRGGAMALIAIDETHGKTNPEAYQVRYGQLKKGDRTC